MAESPGLMGHWDGRPVAVYADGNEALQKADNLNNMYNDYFYVKEMKLQ